MMYFVVFIIYVSNCVPFDGKMARGASSNEAKANVRACVRCELASGNIFVPLRRYIFIVMHFNYSMHRFPKTMFFAVLLRRA